MEGLVLNVCTLSMCLKMLVENEYESLFLKTLFIPSANFACKDPSNRVRVRVRVELRLRVKVRVSIVYFVSTYRLGVGVRVKVIGLGSGSGSWLG